MFQNTYQSKSDLHLEQKLDKRFTKKTRIFSYCFIIPNFSASFFCISHFLLKIMYGRFDKPLSISCRGKVPNLNVFHGLAPLKEDMSSRRGKYDVLP